ncbi:hypothetical protein [Trinickia mobilis]|uniref:hypothetical protein n=1 Tax=Trinickia mobilis TaxID=2816356 RepID=UPI001A8F9B27|nr:hypothetical protein [Trinickia mobilis]
MFNTILATRAIVDAQQKTLQRTTAATLNASRTKLYVDASSSMHVVAHNSHSKMLAAIRKTMQEIRF